MVIECKYIRNDEINNYLSSIPEYGEEGIVVTNVSSTSNEQYIIKTKKFASSYYPSTESSKQPTFIPVIDSRLLTQVDENIIIETLWSEAVCLKGSFIVTYNSDENDYNTLEYGAFLSTYSKDDQYTKTLKPKNS